LRKSSPFLLILCACSAEWKEEDRKGRDARFRDIAEARRHYERAVELNAECTEAWYDLGACKARQAALLEVLRRAGGSPER
jgi:hypothetical protein